MNGAALYNRTWRLRAGTLDVSNLDIEYEVEKTLKNEPNTATITIYGLSAQSRAALSAQKHVNVSLEVGYGGRNSMIFLGQTRGGVTQKQQPEMITTLETGDSEKNFKESRIKLAIGPTMPNSQALQNIARALGVKPGNVTQAAARLQARGVTLFPTPTQFTGYARQALDDFSSAAGLEWSVQDGGLQILDRGGALDAKPYVLTSDSGVTGSPSIDAKGVVQITTLTLPDVRPGLRVLLGMRFAKGLYRISKVRYEGSTRGGNTPWYTHLTCERAKTA